MRAGLLTDKIEVYESVITVNVFGEESTDWKLKTTTRARIVNISGNKSVVNYEVFVDYSKTFEVRYYVDVDEFDRIKWNGKYYRIMDINPDKTQNKKTIKGELINE